MNKQMVNPVYVVVLLICIATGLALMLVKERNKEQMLVAENDLMLKKGFMTGRQTKILNKKINEIRATKSDIEKKGSMLLKQNNELMAESDAVNVDIAKLGETKRF